MPLFSQHTARFSPDVPLEGTSSRELLKRFQPLETLATGGFGSIEICRDTHLRRRVAIKRIPLTANSGMPASDIMDVLREISEQGISVMVNLHSVELVKAYCTRVIGVASGQLIFDDHPSRLTQDVLQRLYGDEVSQLH